MTSLKDYQRYAVRCLEEARTTLDSRHKAFLEAFERWDQLLDELEPSAALATVPPAAVTPDRALNR